MAISRDSGNKMKATFGYCDHQDCKKYYPFGEYTKKFGVVLCNKHMAEHEKHQKN